MSKRFKRLSRTLYECKFPIVFCPKYRFRIFKNDLAEYTRQRIYLLCSQKDLVDVLELNVREDHIHVVISIPPKYSVSSLMGYLKGKLALKLFQRYENLGKRYWGRHLLSTGVLREHHRTQRRRDTNLRTMTGAPGKGD